MGKTDLSKSIDEQRKIMAKVLKDRKNDDDPDNDRD